MWAQDFQFDQTADGRQLKLLNVIDEYSREYLAIDVDRSINTDYIVRCLEGLAAQRGAPVYVRFDIHTESRADCHVADRPAPRTTTPSSNAATAPSSKNAGGPAFHRRRFTSRRQLQAAAGAWLITYNHRRRNHSDYMRGRTPHQILTTHRTQLAS